MQRTSNAGRSRRQHEEEPSNAGTQRSATFRKEHRSLTSSNEIYVSNLNWSSNFTQNNLRVWKEQMTNYAMNKYGFLGLIFEDNEYYEPEEIQIPVNEDGSSPFSEENDPGGFLADDLRAQIKQ